MLALGLLVSPVCGQFNGTWEGTFERIDLTGQDEPFSGPGQLIIIQTDSLLDMEFLSTFRRLAFDDLEILPPGNMFQGPGNELVNPLPEPTVSISGNFVGDSLSATVFDLRFNEFQLNFPNAVCVSGCDIGNGGDGDDIFWTNPAGGSFSTASNWDVDRSPKSTDNAIFDLFNDYQVTLTGNQTERLILRHGTVRFQNGNHVAASLSLSDPSVQVAQNGVLVLSQGARLDSNHAVVGPGLVFVNEAGTIWNNTGRLSLGQDGKGELVVQSGGDLISGETRIGVGQEGEAAVNSPSFWQSGAMAVGFSSPGKLELHGGMVTSTEARIGEGGDGEVNVREAGALWQTEKLEIGLSNKGVLNIENGGKVTSNGDVIFSKNAQNRVDSIDVIGVHTNGMDSRMEIGGTLKLHGAAGLSPSVMQIRNGASANVTRSVDIGIGDLATGVGGNAVLSVAGSSGNQKSGMGINENLNIGANAGGTGLLNVLDAAVVVVFSNTNVGVAAASSGTMNIAGGAKFETADLKVGGQGLARVTIADSATVTVQETVEIGSTSGERAEMTVSHSKLMVNNLIVVGTDSGPGGKLTLEQGVVEGTDLSYGVKANGRIEGTGSLMGSELFNDGHIDVGSSPGTLTIDADFEQGQTGTIELEIGGLVADSEYDVLDITGDAIINGAVLVRFVDGFAPKKDDLFEFLPVGGLFEDSAAAYETQNLLPGFEFDIRFDNGMVSLLALNDGVFRPLGDFDGNGVLDAADIDLLSLEVRQGTNKEEMDLTDDGLVNQADRLFWVKDREVMFSYFGDANLDGTFDTSDLVAVFQSGEYEDGVAANSSWSTGDWNGDNDFDTGDLVFAFQDGGFEQGPREVNAVPEPTSFVMLMAGLVGVVIRRRHLAR